MITVVLGKITVDAGSCVVAVVVVLFKHSLDNFRKSSFSPQSPPFLYFSSGPFYALLSELFFPPPLFSPPPPHPSVITSSSLLFPFSSLLFLFAPLSSDHLFSDTDAAPHF